MSPSLKLDEKDAYSPEALFISALIDTGSYTPNLYSVQDRNFHAWKQVHVFCLDYQKSAGKAPPIHLVTGKYPSFPYTAEPDARWAGEKLVEWCRERDMRSKMLVSIKHLEEGNYDLARAELQDALTSSIPKNRIGKNFIEIDTRPDFSAIPAPVCLNHSDTLEQITGGIRPGNLWFVAARLAVGKTWGIQQMAVAIAEAGWNVNFFSLEMTEEEVADRFNQIALRKVPNYHRLTHDERVEHLIEWQSLSGSIYVRDPSQGALDATEIIASHKAETVSIIDYATLMKPTVTLGKNAESWQHAAGISKELKQAALAYSIPIISAAQVNRTGAASDRIPGAEHMADSDQLGRDADVVITMRRESRRVIVCNLAKNRHGPSMRRWYSVLDPLTNRFGEINRDEALTLMEEDITLEEN